MNTAIQQQSIQYTKAAQHITARLMRVLESEKMLVSPNSRRQEQAVVCYAWPRRERVIIILDPFWVKDPDAMHSDAFLRRLRTVLSGRRVVITNTHGLFVQVGYWPDADIGAQQQLTLPNRVVLDLGNRPSGKLMVPFGVTRRGPLWLSLLETDSVLVGGTRRMGKTMLLHSWIMALVTGERPERTRLILADGKGGIEFNRYANLPHVDAVAGTGEDLAPALGKLRTELTKRTALLQKHNCREISELPASVRPPYLVFIVDELAAILETDGVEPALRDLVSRGGAYGVLPVLATQRPDSDTVRGFLKANLATRISLPVPDHNDSKVILGRTGAEKLPRVKGRILFVWEGRRVTAQAYDVPTDLITQVVARLGQGEAPLNPPLALEDWEKRLVEIALTGTNPETEEPFDGYFPVKGISVVSDVSHRQIERLSRRWELEGLLIPAKYEESTGRKLSRRVTDDLRSLAGL